MVVFPEFLALTCLWLTKRQMVVFPVFPAGLTCLWLTNKQMVVFAIFLAGLSRLWLTKRQMVVFPVFAAGLVVVDKTDQWLCSPYFRRD